LWARIDGLLPSDVQAVLSQARTLVKTWAMRGTLFLFTAKDLPLVVPARKIREYHYWFQHFESYGISKAQYEKFLEAVPQVLGMNGGEPMTREELAVAVAKHTGIKKLAQAVGESNWGSGAQNIGVSWRPLLRSKSGP